jgi:hypothetical protein
LKGLAAHCLRCISSSGLSSQFSLMAFDKSP